MWKGPQYSICLEAFGYLCTSWSPHYNKDKVLLEKIQHRFTRMIPGFSQLDYMTRLNRLNLWRLEECRNRSDLIELFKIYKGLSVIKVESMFEPSTDYRTRGHLLKLMKHRSRLDLRKYFFSERVVNRWNELDEDTVSATTVNMFKSRLQRLRQFKTSFYTDT